MTLYKYPGIKDQYFAFEAVSGGFGINLDLLD